MANRTLFEALTGYEAPAVVEDLGEPAILSAPSGGSAKAGPERSEEDFASVLEQLQERAEDDPLRYRDWRGHDRCVARFAQQADGSLRLAAPIEVLSR